MDKPGRKSRYDSHVKPNLSKIEEWSKEGVTEKSMAHQLGVGYSTFNKYKTERPELEEAIKNGRACCVENIENAMYQRAIGFQYVERKTIYSDKEGEKTEEVVKTALPDVTASIYLLKHWGKGKGYTNDPLTLELKEKEIKLKEKLAENSNW